MTLRETFIRNLRNARKESGLTQTKLADICNTATNYISEIELGKRFPSVEMIEKMAQALQVAPDLLFKNTKKPLKKTINKGAIYKILRDDIQRQLDRTAEKILRRI
ncbi:MAG: helix-turn-helix domain-containing protein [Candidatus Margulisbacteria bacterium]|jgi:transcriptional regulator with XRE-family HTH domain|nr:helix-turn-helix domain-containing protein [Candidatus Margulisiibacteriota bacterium]